MPRYKLTSGDQLANALESEISSQHTVELAVLHMLSCYIFDPNDLHRLLLGQSFLKHIFSKLTLCIIFPEKSPDFSFSKLKYGDIALKFHLDPILMGADMKTFEVHRARIPTLLFKAIVEDISIMMNQYGESMDHKNAEATTRFLAPVSAKRFSLFFLVLFELTLLLAIQLDSCTFQSKHSQYSRVPYIWPYNRKMC
jgi:hypothetical protein